VKDLWEETLYHQVLCISPFTAFFSHRALQKHMNGYSTSVSCCHVPYIYVYVSMLYMRVCVCVIYYHRSAIHPYIPLEPYPVTFAITLHILFCFYYIQFKSFVILVSVLLCRPFFHRLHQFLHIFSRVFVILYHRCSDCYLSFSLPHPHPHPNHIYFYPSIHLYLSITSIISYLARTKTRKCRSFWCLTPNLPPSL